MFGDSSYWIALFDKRDPLANVANNVTTVLPSHTRIVTSDFVVIEVLNALSRLSIEIKHAALSVFQSSLVEVVPFGKDLYEKAITQYVRPDKEWSIVDCTSFVIMHSRNIRDALTYDKHFEQAGFNALLRRGI